jgi:endoglucanase
MRNVRLILLLAVSILSLPAQVPERATNNLRIAGTNTPAHQALRKFLRGANLGNYLEAPPNQNWGQSYSAADFRHIREEGFDHVRIPARWNDSCGPAPDFKINEAFAQKADALVNGALAEGLGAIVNIHHFDDFTTNPSAHTEKFYKLWEHISARYADKTNLVAFELLNEPKDAATTEVLNPIYAEAIRRIRTKNPNRTIFVGPGKWNQISQLKFLALPANDSNIIVTVHSYEPFYFTHQGASWTGDTTATTGILFPGPPATPVTPATKNPAVTNWINRYNTTPAEKNPSSKAAFVATLELAKKWSDENGRPIHIGEFGAYEKADPISRANYYREMRAAAERLGFGWAVWDWKAGFKYWDSAKNAPAPGMREALFPGRVK